MSHVLALVNMSQGGGKTTTVINLASALVRAGQSVLVVDLDPDAALKERVRTTAPLGTPRAPGTLPILRTAEGWDLLPSDQSIAILHQRALYRLVHTPVQSDELTALFQSYDNVLIDGSTDEWMILGEALAAAQEVVIPLATESLLLHDSLDRWNELAGARANLNPNLKLAGVFLARYSPKLRRAQRVLTEIKAVLGDVPCFSAYVGDSDEIRRATARRQSVLAAAPNSRAAAAFQRLAGEIIAARAAPPELAPAAKALPAPALVEPAPVSKAERELPAIYNQPATWLQLAAQTGDIAQAVRYAVLGLVLDPCQAQAVELFERRLLERLDSARSQDVEGLAALGKFLTEHGFDHYAAQLFRRATLLDPTYLSGWRGLSLTTAVEVERARALEMCLRLDPVRTGIDYPRPATRRRTPLVLAPRPRVAALPAGPVRFAGTP